MKKIAINSRKLVLVALFCCSAVLVKAQGFEPGPGFSQVNFGFGVDGWGVPIYAGLDFGISDHVTLGPRASVQFQRDYYSGFATNYGHTILNFMFRGDYHFANHIPALPAELDLYGGVDLGYGVWIRNYDNDAITRNDGMFLNFHAGGRWYWTRHWGANAEFNSGTYGGTFNGGLKIGLSYIF